MTPLLLASGSLTRLRLLRAAGLDVEAVPPRVDEEAAKAALLAEGHGPRAVADALAELKGARVAQRRPEALVLGADQTLDLGGALLSKPGSPAEALEQLRALAGRTHSLFSAAVIHQGGRPVWRHVGEARITLRRMSEPWLAAYVERNWEAIRHSVGGYLIEGEGVQMMSQVEGDHFTVLGLPLLPLVSFLQARGDLPS
jgi:septum formation protein